MKFGRCFTLVLLISFFLSWHGRLEPDFDSSHSSFSFRAADCVGNDDQSSDVPTAPAGDHRDHHGSHAPFLSVKSILERPLASTLFIAPMVYAPHSLDLTNILNPPRV